MFIRHDLLGCSNRLKKLTSTLNEESEIAKEIWQDGVAEKFFREQISEITRSVDSLAQNVGQICQQLEKIDRALQDPDR